MTTLADRLDAAIETSGKTHEQIADAVGANRETIRRLRHGHEVNPGIQLLSAIAREVNTTVGALLGESLLAITPEDEDALLRFRSWIDGKLATIDARLEPNATIEQQAPVATPAARIADHPRSATIASPFGSSVHLVLRATGISMIEAGIVPDDLLHATPFASTDPAAAAGQIIACRLGDEVFVKRLVSEHRRLFLVSAHPRYRAIRVDLKSFEILGIIVGRVGAPRVASTP